MGDLRWKLEYEQGLHAEMVELLEKKVAGNLVRIHTFEEAEEELKTKTSAQETQISEMQVKIKHLCD